MPPQTSDRKTVISWALYDWANSAFVCTVLAVFFPVFLKKYWGEGLEPTESTLVLGAASSTESIIVAIIAPILGAIADRGRSRKKFLFFFAALGILATCCLYFVSRGDWLSAAVLFVLAAGGYAASLVLYDSLLVGICSEKKRDSVSALGYALGYLGGGLLLALNVAMTSYPEAFGLPDAGTAVRVSFVTVAVWWALFSIPLLLWVPEPRVRSPVGPLQAVPEGFRQLAATFREIRKLKVVFWFLLGYWLYIDGIDTIMRMAVDYGISIGLEEKDLVLALLLTQFVGFPAAIAFGWIGGKLGTKKGILLGLAVYTLATVWGFFMDSASEFYALAAVVGLVQGGVQALSRSFYSRIIPQEKAGEFYGFYNMLGKFAAILGPLLMGLVGYVTGNPRHAILSLIVLFAAGAAILWFVDEDEGKRAAAEFEALT